MIFNLFLFPNIALLVTKHYVLVLLDLSEIQELNVSGMLTSVCPILADLMPDVLIWLEPLIVNVNLDALEMDELVVNVHHHKWMAVSSRSVVPMLNVDLKMALDNVIAHLTFHMATLTKVVRHHLEVRFLGFLFNLFC